MPAKIIYLKEVTENEFMGITPPPYQFFNVNLSQTVTVGREKKSQNEVSRVNDYSITINASSINEDQLPAVGKVLQDLFQLKWVPYDYKTKSYNYFTTRFQDEKVKQSQLTQILEYLQEFEVQYAKTVSQSLELFNEDSISKASYKDAEIAVKYDEDKKSFVVLALSYLGTEKYSLLSKASIEKGVLEKEEDKEFFSDLVPDNVLNSKKKLFFFVVKPASYISVKSFIEKQVEDNKNFYEEQKNIMDKVAQEDLPLYDKPNLFDFKITYNDNTKCFNFYCKGYNKNINPNSGEEVPKALLGNWAVNYILSEEILDEEARKTYPSKFNDDDISRSNFYKIPLEFLPGSLSKEKNWIVAGSDIEKLRKIKSNFLEYENLFNREEVTIKVIDNDFYSSGSNLNRYPSIYLDEKGSPYFIYNFRKIAASKNTEQSPDDIFSNYYSSKVEPVTIEDLEKVLDKSKLAKAESKKQRPSSVNMKGVPITFPEMEKFLTNHDWAKEIRNNTVYLNAEVWFRGEDANFGTNFDDMEKMFDKLYLHAKIHYQSSLVVGDKQTPIKKKKI